MKKEKTIRTYQRRTKSGKVVTVRQHTAKYDAAEELRKALSKKGAGDEFEGRKGKQAVQLDFGKKQANEDTAEDSSLKVGDSVQMGNALNNGRGNKETFKVLAVQKTNKQDRDSGNTEAAWVQRKDGSVTLALKDSKKGWMYDDTWSDFTSRKHPYAKSLETAGYSFKKASGNGGEYWEVSKKSRKDSDPKNKAALKVEKVLKKQMGTKAYNKYFDEVTDSYSARGHNKAFKGLGEKLSTGEKKSVISSKETKGDKSAKAKAQSYEVTVAQEDAKTQEKEAKTLDKKVDALEKKLRDLKYAHSGLKRNDPKKLKYAERIQKLQADLIATKKASGGEYAKKSCK